MKKYTIAVTSFGTSHKDAYDNAIRPFYEYVKDNFLEAEVFEAFTSNIISKMILEREGRKINYKDVFEECKSKGFEHNIVFSLHFLAGREYAKISQGNIITRPLFQNKEDIKDFVRNIRFDKQDADAVVLMGHGTDVAADFIYERVEEEYRKFGDDYIYIATVEGRRTLDDIIPVLKRKNIKKLVLAPFMLVAGDHAKNDMAGEEDSWKSRLEQEGFEVKIDLTGLGERLEVRELFYKRLRETIDNLTFNEKRKVFAIGTGPGDTDLLTLKAVKTIERADVIFVPDNKGKSMAFDTIQKFVKNQRIVHLEYPMGQVTEETYKNNFEIIDKNLSKGEVGVFVTIGDAMIYSTFINTFKFDTDIELEFLAGIPSFLAALNTLKLPLAYTNQNFVLTDNIDNVDLDKTSCVAVLKTYRRETKEKIIQAFEKKNFEYVYISNISFPNEKILYEADKILEEENYMSLMIGRRHEE